LKVGVAQWVDAKACNSRAERCALGAPRREVLTLVSDMVPEPRRETAPFYDALLPSPVNIPMVVRCRGYIAYHESFPRSHGAASRRLFRGQLRPQSGNYATLLGAHLVLHTLTRPHVCPERASPPRAPFSLRVSSMLTVNPLY
jgi:hypothetical protein